jgi:quercetin dioxygenase-like cupin family protein
MSKAQIEKVLKPWGHEEIWAHTDKYVGKLLHIKKGSRLSLQYHEVKEETIYVLQGTLTLLTDKDRINLEPGSVYHIPPGSMHRFTAGAESVTLIEVSTPELDDVVRVEDDHGRI